MITKSDWQSVHQDLVADGRRRVGEPPTADELLAYSRGELSAEEEERMRELLMSYPELVRTLTVPFPAEGAEPGDPDYLSEHEFASHWKSLQKKMATPKEVSMLQFWRTSAVLAAALVLVFGGLLWKARSDLGAPRAGWEEQMLMPEGQRGGSSVTATLVGTGQFYVVVLTIPDSHLAERFRVEIVDDAGKPRWSGTLPPRTDDLILSLSVPRRFLKPGKYQIVLYGVNGATESRLETYALRVPDASPR